MSDRAVEDHSGDESGSPRARARAALTGHGLGHLGHLGLRPFGSGLDNTAFLAGDHVLRVSRGPDVTSEAGLLTVVARAGLGVAVPEPLFADAALGVLCYPRLPGRPLLGREVPPGSAVVIGDALRRLHAIEPATVDGLVPREPADTADWVDGLTGPPDLVSIVRSELPAPGTAAVLCHNDLGAEHLLADDAGVTGIIDWSDAAVTDPAIDFARILRDFGPVFLDSVLHAYGGLDDAMPRIRFYARCAALEDLEFARTTGRTEYADNAVRSFAWLFPDRRPG